MFVKLVHIRMSRSRRVATSKSRCHSNGIALTKIDMGSNHVLDALSGTQKESTSKRSMAGCLCTHLHTFDKIVTRPLMSYRENGWKTKHVCTVSSGEAVTNDALYGQRSSVRPLPLPKVCDCLLSKNFDVMCYCKHCQGQSAHHQKPVYSH